LPGLDEWIADLAQGEALFLVLLVALLLGLRHASDPDHLAAVSILIASEPEDGTRRAGRLGLAWGLGHGLTLAVFGLPIVLFHAYLPGAAQRAAEALVGVMIMLLAGRLLIRWRRGHFHAHPHRHGDVEHRHLHAHGDHGTGHDHAHEPQKRLGRSPLQAFGIGLVHGLGGSAGVGVLLLATIPGQAEAVAALLVLALGTAASMAIVSSAFGYAITRGPVLSRILALAPAMGVLAMTFGGWYALGAASLL
jgi:ABC-type nickel/cobalt efflux system permease component RcnA